MAEFLDRNIVKFGLYGFLKNLKFFEPFFYLYLLSIGLNYFQIGIVLSVREVSGYVFEIPTGVIADVWGRRRSMLLCFVFYGVSFATYYISHTFWLLVPASVFFGLGEAFRLGTHKAIIFDYLDDRGIGHVRTRIYGFTRSVALLGSAVSAVGAGAVVLLTENYHAIFLFSIFPYFLAFCLVLTYPRSAHDCAATGRKDLWTEVKKHSLDSLRRLKKVKDLRVSLINSAIYDGAFKASRDYIQPLIQGFILGAAALSFTGDVQSEGTVLISGFYLIIFLAGATASQKAHKFETLFGNVEKPLNILFLLNIAAFAGVGITAGGSLVAVIVIFVLLFIFKNLRRPILLDYLTGHIEPGRRATMLSIESQLRSLSVVLLAPVLGLVADTFTIGTMFLALAVVLAILHVMLLRFNMNNNLQNHTKTVG